MSVGGNPIPDDVRAGLPPQALQLIEEYDAEFGVGNDISFQVAQSYAAVPNVSPDVGDQERQSFRRTPVTEGEIGVLEGEAITARAQDIMLNEPNISRNEAFERASLEMGELAERRRRQTTVEGQVVSASSEDDIRNAESAFTAFRRSLGPQQVRVGHAQQLEELGLPQQEIDRLRKSIIIESKVEARRIAREEGFDYDRDSVAFDSFVERTSGRIMAKRLKDLHADFYRSAERTVLQEQGLDPEEGIPKGEEGRELRLLAESRADDTYNYIVPVVFEDLGAVEVDGVSLVPEAKPGAIRRMHERFRKGEQTLGDYVIGGFYSNWHDFDPGSGEVSETWMSAIVRDVGLVPRAITYPIMRATTWDMNPETGEAYDKDDPMYRLSQWQEEQLANGNVLEKGAAFLSGIFMGHGYNLDESMHTGSVLRDFALSHARGEMLHTDFGNLQATRTAQNAGVLPHWWDEFWGIGLEVVAPLQTAKLPFTAAARTTQGGARVMRGIAEAANFDRVADVSEAIRAAASKTDSLSDGLVLRQFRRQAYEDLDLPVPPKSPLRGAIEAPERFIDEMSADIAKKLVTADDHAAMRKMFAGIGDDNPLMMPLSSGFLALREFRALGKLKGARFMEKVKDLEKSRSGRVLLAEMEAAAGLKLAGRAVPDDVLAFNVIQGVIKNDVRKLAANHIPNNFVFAAPNLIVRRGAWLANQDNINKAFGKVIKGEQVKVKGESYWKFENGKEAAGAARKAFSRSDLAPSVNKLIDDVESTGLVPIDKYMPFTDLVKESVVYENLSTGSLAVQAPMELAATRASSLSNQRALTKARFVEDMAKGARAFFRGDSDYRFVVSKTADKKGGKLFRPVPSLFASNAPEQVRFWYEQTLNELNNVSRKAEDLVREANKSAEPDEAMNEILTRFGGDESLQAYEDLVNIFFEPDPMGLTEWVGRHSDIKQWLRSANLPKEVTIDGFKQAIAVIRKKTPAYEIDILEAGALKEQRFAGIGVTKTDNLTAAMSAYITNKIADDVFESATTRLIDEFPNLTIRVPTRGDASTRLEMFRDIARTQGISKDVIDKVSTNVKAALLENQAHRRAIAVAIVKNIAKDGNLATVDDLDRIYDATMGSVAGVTGADKSLVAAYDPSIHAIGKRIRQIDPENAEEIMRKVVPAYIKAVANVDMASVRAQFEAVGIQGRLGKPTAEIVGFTNRDFGDGVLFYDGRLKDVMRGLGESEKRRSILKAMERLRPNQRSAFTWIQETFSTTRKTTISGILGGFPLPGTRFLGTNALTNPFITAITAPEYALTVAMKTPSAVAQSFGRAFRRAGFLPGDRAYDPLKMMYTGNETDIMFKAADGRVWTKGMFQEAVEKNNIRFSQVTFEFGFDSFQDTNRISRLGPGGVPIQSRARFVGGPEVPQRQYWEFLRPDKRNVWTMAAEEMDNLQREAVFAQALKSGLREKEAAALARNSLLDYGSVPQVVRDTFARNMAFFAFRYNMMVETMKAFVRDGRALNNMARQMNFINVQRDSMEEWVLQPDWLKTRFWLSGEKRFREWHSVSTGPGIPFADSFAGLVNIGSMIFDSKLRNSIGIGGAVKGLGEGVLSDPRIQQLFDIGALAGDSSAPDGYMPIEYVAAFEAFGAGDLLLGLFNCKIVAPDKQRPDIGTFKGNQYQFGDSGSNQLFKLFQLGLLTTGLNRNLRDYPRQLASIGIEPDNIQFAKGAEGGPMFWLGGSVGSYRDAQAALDRINRAYTREIEEGMRKTSF